MFEVTYENPKWLLDRIETYLNGTSWYRIYAKDDYGYWCEQGGTITNKASSLTVTFLKTFVSTDYSLMVYKRGTDNDTGGYADVHCTVSGADPYDGGQSTTGFRCSTQSSSAKFTWKACGYIEVENEGN